MEVTVLLLVDISTKCVEEKAVFLLMHFWIGMYIPRRLTALDRP
jgi:hypothetical protein